MTANVFRPAGPKRFAHQRQGLQDLIRNRGVHALLWDAGVGKALDIATEVPIPTGWTTMGALRTGDTVYAPDGSETLVIAHEPYEAETWRLTFSDGTEVTADGDHLWVVESRGGKGGRWKPEAVKSTEELAATLTLSGKLRHLVRMTGPVEGSPRTLPIDPYVLGVWLGDGTSSGGGLTLGEKDADEILVGLKASGERPRISRVDGGSAYVSMPSPDPGQCSYGHLSTGVQCVECAHAYYLRRKYGTPLPYPSNAPLSTRLGALGVRGNKHIPMAYLRASRADRLELLRGLVDTDGWSNGQRVEVCFMNQALSEGTAELLCSLGERPTMHESDAAVNGRVVGRRWRISWTPRLHDPAHLSRRRIDPQPDSPRLRGRYLVDAQPAGRRLVRCLTVASSTAQYLVTRSWLPTHNTAATIDYATLLALKSPTGQARVLVVAPLAAVDTWVLQTEIFVSEDVDVHAEAVLTGSLRQRAERLAALGGKPFTRSPKSKRRGPSYDRVTPTEDGQPSRPTLHLAAVNFDSFASKARSGGSGKTAQQWMEQAAERYAPDLIVVDESHRIKGAYSNTSLALGRVGKHSRRRIILTGTVLPHSPLDVWAQWRFLDPEAFTIRKNGIDKPMAFGEFRERYAVIGGFMGKQVIGFQRLDEMKEIMAERSTVVRKEDVLDLPPVTDVYVPVNLSPTEQRAYSDLKKKSKKLVTVLPSGKKVAPKGALARIMRLRQITSGHLPDEAGNIEVLGTSKVDTVRSVVQDNLPGESRVVVFAHFRHEVAAISAALDVPGTEVLTVSGDTAQEDRLLMRKRFGSDDPARLVMVAQIRTMSLAVNELVTASHAVFASLPNQRDDIEQARARLDRQGQTRPVTIWTVAAPRTIDDVIIKSYRDRTSLEAAMLDHVTESD